VAFSANRIPSIFNVIKAHLLEDRLSGDRGTRVGWFFQPLLRTLLSELERLNDRFMGIAPPWMFPPAIEDSRSAFMISLRRLFSSRSIATFVLVLLTAFVVACAGGESTDDTAVEAPAPPAAPEPISYDPAILDVDGRSEDDHYRDGGMKPLEVYAFFGVEPGMTIGDLSTSMMYNAHILSQIAGPDGKVYAIIGLGDAVNPRSRTRTETAYAERSVGDVLANVEVIDTLEDLPDNSLDVLITVRNYHDFGEREARVANVPRMLRVLKPGGILGAIDAYTDKTDERDESVHRINEALAREEIIEGGFEFVEASELLYNSEDTFDFDGRGADDPIKRYYIQRWTLKFAKPLN
jgi:predicted methyltransferase